MLQQGDCCARMLVLIENATSVISPIILGERRIDNVRRVEIGPFSCGLSMRLSVVYVFVRCVQIY